MLNRRQLLGSMAVLGATICSRGAFAESASRGAPGDGSPLDTRLDAVFDRMMALDPSIATLLGLDGGARQELKVRLKTAGPDHRLGGHQALVEALPELKRFDRTALAGHAPYYLDTVIWAGDRAADLAKVGFGTFDNWPMPYVISQLSGSYQAVPDFLKQQHRIDTREDADGYLHRLEDFARLVSAECDMAEADAARDVVPPDFILDLAKAQTDALRSQRGERSPLVTSLAERAAEKNLAGTWSQRASRIVDGPLATALERQAVLLTRLRARATADASLAQRKDGDRFYAVALRTHVTIPAAATEIHRVGLAQVAELIARTDSLLRQQGMTRGSVAQRLTALNTQPAQIFTNDDKGRAAILAYLDQCLTAVRSRMPAYFANVPTAPVELRRIPEANELGAVAAYAMPGNLDGTRPGAFYINLRDTAAWPKYSLPTLVFHEAIPGHLWDSAITQGLASLPVINKYFYFAAFTEGWALYAEELADEAGLYEQDPFGRIGLQQSLLLRAARIVADTGIHAMGWSRKKATDYMVGTVGVPLVTAQNEVDRYCALPGQACGYKIGHGEIRRLLQRSRSKLGSRLDLKAWHDAVLSAPVPLEILDRLLADWDRRQING